MERFEDFRKYFGKGKSGKFWKVITRQSLIPLEQTQQKEELLRELYSELVNSRYMPTNPRGYLLINKGMSIVRIVPVLSPKDICAYYYFTKKLEPDIAGNRVPYTYGGWSLGGELRKTEDMELTHISKSMRVYEMPDGETLGFDESVEYPMEASFNSKAWKTNWQNFTGALYTHSRQNVFEFVAELDIANFYDNISIDVLGKKLNAISSDKITVDFLLNFLRSWDSSIKLVKTVGRGIPQDEIADCSRLIANFYLQDFDDEMHTLCEKYGAKYFRYADDQVIFARSREDVQEIIAKASVMILKHGLCFNNGKAKIMSKVEFEEYFSFDWFIERKEKTIIDKNTLLEDLDYYTKRKQDLRHQGVSVLLRILWLAPQNIDIPELDIMRKTIVNQDFLSSPKLQVWHLEKLYKALTKEEKGEMISELRALATLSLHNRFHFILLKFFKSIKENTNEVEERIKELESIFELK